MSKPVFGDIGLMALLLFSLTPTQADPASDAAVAAMELVNTMKLDQFNALMPTLVKTMNPASAESRRRRTRPDASFAPMLMQGMEAASANYPMRSWQFMPAIDRGVGQQGSRLVRRVPGSRA